MWKYKNKVVNSIEDLPYGTIGFIYMIINKSRLKSNKEPYLYIGKKSIYSNTTKKLGKRAIEALPDKRMSKKIKIKKESDWLNYTGSNTELNFDILSGDEIERKILCVCYNLRELTYMETKYLFKHEVLEKKHYYNGNILSKFFKIKK
jgi:hypothetical protein